MKMKGITSIPKSNLDCLALSMTEDLSSTKIWMDNEQGKSRGNRLVVHVPRLCNCIIIQPKITEI